MFQKKQIIYSEALGLCKVDNIVSLTASKAEPPTQYYVLHEMFGDKVSYIPVEHHQVVLRELFSKTEASKLINSEEAAKNERLKQALEYVLEHEE